MILKDQATLIITHPTPDLDAIGFVYAARQVCGAGTPVVCRTPTEAELADPTVVVGDIGRPGCEAIGYSPALNNFDHHYSYAERSATWLFNRTYRALRDDIVAYIDAVDTTGMPEAAGAATLKAATVGVRVRHNGDDAAILAAGGQFLHWLEETGQLPGDITGAPDDLQVYLATGQAELHRIQDAELPTMQRATTRKGRTVGFLVSASPVVSIVKEEMFATGLEIAVVCSSTTNRYAIAADVRGASPLNLKRAGLADALNAEEWRRGTPPEQHWAGHDDRIGSPRPAGSRLKGDEVLAITVATL